MRIRLSEGLECCLEIALGIDQECSRSHDFFAFDNTLQDLNITIPTATDFHWPRLEATLALRNKYDLTGAAVDDGTSGNGDRGLFV